MMYNRVQRLVVRNSSSAEAEGGKMEEKESMPETEPEKKKGILARIRAMTPEQKRKATTAAACMAVAFLILCYVQF